ncbi:hypothetical protein EKO24_021330 [Candidatus Methylobacter oryzae]|uniref:Hydrogenase n=2 Tax=Candidatus Methylobacter oryzae TaxID=2497749 RepID=A0ABY3C4G8_9GAMM|nr:hypothetical protein EKO24_021330 [Candidatus Methylobacter oryzae]
MPLCAKGNACPQAIVESGRFEHDNSANVIGAYVRYSTEHKKNPTLNEEDKAMPPVVAPDNQSDTLLSAVTDTCRSDPAIACDESDTAVLAIIKVIRAANKGELPLFAATLGMASQDFAALLDELSRRAVHFSPCHAGLLAGLPDLFPPLVEMLWESRSCDERLSWWTAHAIASACFGRGHLWQDLGLRGRDDVSRLFSQRFSELFALNIENLKWKRFLFQELGRRLGYPDLKPPACDACDETNLCFPSQRGDVIALY